MKTRLCSPRARRARIASSDGLRQAVLGAFGAQVDGADRGQLRARHRALGQRRAARSGRRGVEPGLQRGRRGAEHHRAAGELGARRPPRRARSSASPSCCLNEASCSSSTTTRPSRGSGVEHRKPRAEHDLRVAARGVAARHGCGRCPRSALCSTAMRASGKRVRGSALPAAASGRSRAPAPAPARRARGPAAIRRR